MSDSVSGSAQRHSHLWHTLSVLGEVRHALVRLRTHRLKGEAKTDAGTIGAALLERAKLIGALSSTASSVMA